VKRREGDDSSTKDRTEGVERCVRACAKMGVGRFEIGWSRFRGS
jgi:hypothetical protein